MAIRLRLARHRLSRNAAQYNLVATESHLRATAQPLELLGTFNPRPQVLAPVQRSPNGQRRSEKEWGPGQYQPRTANAQVGIKAVEWNLERVRHWLSQGALPTKAVEKLLVQAGVLGQSLPPGCIRADGDLEELISFSLASQTRTRSRHRHKAVPSCRGSDDSARRSGRQRRHAARSRSRNEHQHPRQPLPLPRRKHPPHE